MRPFKGGERFARIAERKQRRAQVHRDFGRRWPIAQAFFERQEVALVVGGARPIPQATIGFGERGQAARLQREVTDLARNRQARPQLVDGILRLSTPRQ